MSLKNEIASGDVIELNGEMGKVIAVDETGFSFLTKTKYGTKQTFYVWKELEDDTEEVEESEEED